MSWRRLGLKGKRPWGWRWGGGGFGLTADVSHRDLRVLLSPPHSPPPPRLAPTDRTYWPVFNKAPVLGRFLSSSINCRRGVTRARERARDREHERRVEREGERDGQNEGRRRERLIWLRDGGSREWGAGIHFGKSSLLGLHFSTSYTADSRLVEYETATTRQAVVQQRAVTAHNATTLFQRTLRPLEFSQWLIGPTEVVVPSFVVVVSAHVRWWRLKENPRLASFSFPLW